jgi:hypothetical protein
MGKTVDEEKVELLGLVQAKLDTDGYWTCCTCPSGEVFGWHMPTHYALEWFMRHPPAGWHIARIYRHECYDWTITKK